MGYHQPSGEVHIMDNNEWVSCPGKNCVSRLKGEKNLTGHNLPIGQDNPSGECIVGDVPTILEGNVNDHNGPYNGAIMNC